jgi:hypothetical protein
MKSLVDFGKALIILGFVSLLVSGCAGYRSTAKSLGNSGFIKEAEFPVVIPLTSSVDEFCLAQKDSFLSFSPEITDANFPPLILKNKKEKTAVIYRLKKGVKTSDECLELLAQEGELPGIHGLILAYEQGKKYFPKNSWVIGFDSKENLWKDPTGNRRVPLIKHFFDDTWHFPLGQFSQDWYSGSCFLIFK